MATVLIEDSLFIYEDPLRDQSNKKNVGNTIAYCIQ